MRLGAGTDADADAAIRIHPQLEAFLSRKKDERSSLAKGYAALSDIVDAGLGKGKTP
jgi:flagellar biosynthesis/type III secretory pathway ATPase